MYVFVYDAKIEKYRELEYCNLYKPRRSNVNFI